MERIPFPRVQGDYTVIYRPAGDIYRGDDSEYFRKDTYYDRWTVNDFSIINNCGRWHLIGITHPTPPTFLDEYNSGPSVHDAEHMLFHAEASGETMADILYDSSFSDREKILYPKDRPDEIPECHAPHIMTDGKGGFRILYGPKYIRMAVTRDFVSFDRRVLFRLHPTARDPYVFEDDGVYYIIFAVENRVDYCTTTDFITFSDTKTLQINPWRNEAGMAASSESPFMFKRKGFYYLMWAIWDRRAGCYDHRTFVFGARTIEGLAHTAPLTMLPAHAGEIYSDSGGDYLLSVYYPENGISAVPLVWENDF